MPLDALAYSGNLDARPDGGGFLRVQYTKAEPFMGNSVSGSDWTEDEIDLIVSEYFVMLQMEISGIAFVKSQRNRALRDFIGRSRGSIEYKLQNISAVLEKLGIPWIIGYKPMHNYQEALINGIDQYLSRRGANIQPTSEQKPLGLAEAAPLYFEQPPAMSAAVAVGNAFLKRLVRKFDPAERDEKNRALGEQGEQRILMSERSRLSNSGRPDLSRRIRWVAKEDGDGAGFDILSFDERGAELLLEVKTTNGHLTTPFYLSENERLLAVERPTAFRLVRLFDFARSPRAFQIISPLENYVFLRPTNYRAAFS